MKYLKKFNNEAEQQAYKNEETTHIYPHVHFIIDGLKFDYHSRNIFPLYLTTIQDANNKYRRHADPNCKVKTLYDYYFANCLLDPSGANGETYLHLTDEQKLYIDGTRVERLYHYNDLGETIEWWPLSPNYTNGGGNDYTRINADGSIDIDMDD